LTKKQILKKSLRLSIILTILNVVFSVVLSKVFSGNLERGQVISYLGNITLLEASFMFLYGSAVDYTSTERWASTLKILKLSTASNEEKEGEKTSFEEHVYATKNSTKEVSSEKKRNSETRAITYILCGLILLVEIVVLTLLNG
jgi:hypothetical protein